MKEYYGLFYDSDFVINPYKEGRFLMFRFNVNWKNTYIVNHRNASYEGHEIAYWDQNQWHYRGVRIAPKEVVVFLTKVKNTND